jgi:hypothetical protein
LGDQRAVLRITEGFEIDIENRPIEMPSDRLGNVVDSFDRRVLEPRLLAVLDPKFLISSIRYIRAIRASSRSDSLSAKRRQEPGQARI